MWWTNGRTYGQNTFTKPLIIIYQFTQVKLVIIPKCESGSKISPWIVCLTTYFCRPFALWGVPPNKKISCFFYLEEHFHWRACYPAERFLQINNPNCHSLLNIELISLFSRYSPHIMAKQITSKHLQVRGTTFSVCRTEFWILRWVLVGYILTLC